MGILILIRWYWPSDPLQSRWLPTPQLAATRLDLDNLAANMSGGMVFAS